MKKEGNVKKSIVFSFISFLLFVFRVAVLDMTSFVCHSLVTSFCDGDDVHFALGLS